MKKTNRWQERILFVLLIVLTWLVASSTTISRVDTWYANARPTPEPIVEDTEPELVDKASAEEVAKVLYGIRDNDDEELTAVVWCIINRVESALYPNSVIEVCQQPKQWMGYYEDNPVLDDLYGIAYDVLYSWATDGHRPFSQEYLWFTWTSDQITFRTDFEEGRGCKYWRAG